MTKPRTSSAPRKDVIDVRERIGPRGGTLLIMTLECGHGVWKRGKTPPRTMECISCWLEANPE